MTTLFFVLTVLSVMTIVVFAELGGPVELSVILTAVCAVAYFYNLSKDYGKLTDEMKKLLGEQ